MPANPTPEQQALYEHLVDALNALFGSHPGFRAAHAKGIVCEGIFNPAPEAVALCRAVHLRGDTLKVTIRFSNGTGLPAIPDNDPFASPHGMAIKFHLPGEQATDIVAHSYNGFPTGTAEEFLEFLRAVATSPPGAEPSPQLGAFLASHPRALAFVTAPKPAPVSFAHQSFFSLHAFRFLNRAGTAKFGRYFIRPSLGEKHLDEKQTAEKSADYLFDELRARLSKGLVQFQLKAQLAAPGDPTHDASQIWPDNRTLVSLGAISVTTVVPDSDAAQRRLIFDPIRLTDGIELGDDPLPVARSGAYSVSYARRNP